MKILVLLAVSIATAQVFANVLTSPYQILSFECQATSPQGVSQFSYQQNRDRTVQVLRNSITNVQYDLTSAGVVGQSMQIFGSHHMTFSGGPLAGNQYLSFLFSGALQPGENRIAGSVLLVTQGGSVFAPTVGSVYPIGQFQCPSFVLRD